MNDPNKEPLPALDQVGSALTGLGYQLRKGLDRVGFEADKRMRVNRVRVEVGPYLAYREIGARRFVRASHSRPP